MFTKQFRNTDTLAVWYLYLFFLISVPSVGQEAPIVPKDKFIEEYVLKEAMEEFVKKPTRERFFNEINQGSDEELGRKSAQLSEYKNQNIEILLERIAAQDSDLFDKIGAIKLKTTIQQDFNVNSIISFLKKAGFRLDVKDERTEQTLIEDIRYSVEKNSALDQSMEELSAVRHDRVDAKSWQKDYEKLLACSGVKTTSINLETQFLPTEDQGKLGACYAKAPKAVAEAALSRSGIKNVKPFSTEYAMVLARDKYRDDWSKLSHMLYLLKYNDEASDPDVNKRHEAGGIYHGGIEEHVATALIEQSTVPVDDEVLQKKYNTLVGSHKIDPNWVQDRDHPYQEVYGMIDPTYGIASSLYSEKKKFDELRTSLNAAEKSFLSSVRNSKKHRMQSTRDLGLAQLWKYGGSKCDEQSRLRMIEALMKALCAKLPVLFSYNTSGSYTILPFGTLYNVGEIKAGNHAVAIVGVEMFNGVPMFVGRGSYAKGTSSNPYASYELIPFSRMCQAFNASVIYTKQEAAMVQKLFPEGFKQGEARTSTTH